MVQALSTQQFRLTVEEHCLALSLHADIHRHLSALQLVLVFGLLSCRKSQTNHKKKFSFLKEEKNRFAEANGETLLGKTQEHTKIVFCSFSFHHSLSVTFKHMDNIKLMNIRGEV